MEVYDFSEKVFQEALLNAMSHRSYENNGAIYVKHYSDKVVIEKSAVENEQFVKFVVSEQDTNEFMSLSELMILRYLSDNRKLNLSEAKDLTQLSELEVNSS